MHYLDFEYRLIDTDRASIRVEDRDYGGRPTLDGALRQRLREERLNPQRYGEMLFEALFPADRGDLLTGYRKALDIARELHKPLRFRLHIVEGAPVDLHQLDWELLLDPHPAESLRLGCSPDTPFSRYLGVDRRRVAPISERPRLLLVLANPANLPDYGLFHLDAAQVEETLAGVLRPLRRRFHYEILAAPATPERIRERLVDGRFHAVHILAHGQLQGREETARLVLADDQGRAAFTEETTLANLFEGLWSLRLVTLMACHGGVPAAADPFSGLGPRLVRRGIPAVVAMRRAIEVETAARFTERFYARLVDSGQIDVAVNEARTHLYLRSPEGGDWAVPALFMRLTDGRVWTQGSAEGAVTGISPPRVEEPTWDGWAAVLTNLARGRLLPVLGPGMNEHFLPSRKAVAQGWAAEHNYPLVERVTLPCVSQFMQTKRLMPHDALPEVYLDHLLQATGARDPKRFRHRGLAQVTDSLAEQLFGGDRNEPHRILAGLPIPTYLTTNFDSFLAGALSWSGKRPLRRAFPWNEGSESLAATEAYKDLEGTVDNPLVFHLYGHDEEPASQVLTEDDHLDFLGQMVKDIYQLPPTLLRDLNRSMLLFLGYDVSTLDCRVLFRGLITQLARGNTGRIAVLQIHSRPHDREKEKELRLFLDRYCQGLNIYVAWNSVGDFLGELHKRWVDHG
jgi:hypothetical protein